MRTRRPIRHFQIDETGSPADADGRVSNSLKLFQSVYRRNANLSRKYTHVECVNHVYTRIVHAHIRVDSIIYVELFWNRSVFIWFETTSLRVAKVNNNRPAASLVAKVFECF